VIPITDSGELVIPGPTRNPGVFTDHTKILAISHVSNTLGTINPIKELIAEAKKRGIITVVDGAQAIPHLPVDVQDLGCDLYAFSGHKMYAPTGFGVLYGREELLEQMPPWQGGARRSGHLEKTTMRQTASPRGHHRLGRGRALDAGLRPQRHGRARAFTVGTRHQGVTCH
jgi:cysteine desulfurase/selenocysteine lyase